MAKRLLLEQLKKVRQRIASLVKARAEDKETAGVVSVLETLKADQASIAAGYLGCSVQQV